MTFVLKGIKTVRIIIIKCTYVNYLMDYCN